LGRTQEKSGFFCNNLHYLNGLPPKGQAVQPANWFYQPLPIPQALGSSGGQVGIGTALVLAMVTLLEVLAALEIWVEAAKPVRARATTKARTTFFMMTTPKVVFTV